jgi:hypothetical protein
MSNRRSEEERMDEEYHTVEHFLNVIEHKLGTSHHVEDLLLGGGFESQDYEVERDLLMKVNNMGLMEGTIAGCVTFASLVGGPYIVKRLRPPKTYTLDTPGGSKIGTLLLKGARLGIQVAASLVIAAYTSYYYTDEDEMLKQVASTPLLPGRSVIADEFCDSLVNEYHRIHPPEYWKQVQDPYLHYLTIFTTNCQKRRAYEKRIREQANEGPDVPVSIPFPGVPVDYLVEEDETSEFLSGESNESSFRHDEAEEWARGLVTDQEMDDERHRQTE